MKKTILLGFVFVSMSFSAFADEANLGIYGSSVEMMESSEVRMVEETVIVNVDRVVHYNEYVDDFVNETRNRFFVEYVFENTSDEAVTVKMGFPEDCNYYCGSDYDDSYKLHDFQARVDGELLPVTFLANEPSEEYSYEHSYNWYVSEVAFAPGERRVVTNSYWGEPSSYKGGRRWVNYTLETGASWKGTIGKADVYVYFNDDLSLYDVDEVSSDGYSFNLKRDRIEWHLTDLEPTSADNIMISYYDSAVPDFISCDDFLDWMNEGPGWWSSYLDSEGNLNYYPCYVDDGDISTSWVEGVDGDGVGEWVMLENSYGKNYAKFRIFSGYGANEVDWKKNNRPKKVRVFFTSDPYYGEDSVDIIHEEFFELEDKYGYQEFDFTGEVDEGLIYLEILDVYEGTQYSDTAIAEAVVLGLIEGVDVVESASPFTDLDGGHANSVAVEFLRDKGVIDGYSDGTFKPEGLINRAELMKLVVAMKVGDPVVDGGCFSDVGEAWFAPYVCYAAEQGWVDGYSDGTFRPAAYTNRAEAMKIIMNAFYGEGNMPEGYLLALGPGGPPSGGLPGDVDVNAGMVHFWNMP